MTTEALRRTSFGFLISALLLVSACAHKPADDSLKGPAPTAVGVIPAGSNPSDAVPPTEASGTYPVPSVPGATTSYGTESASALEPQPVVGLTPAQYSDLFDRIRAGFKLDDSEDRRAIDAELNWYASNPQYLERAFGRAELYLYHIVAEIEARGMPLELALLPVVESAFEPYAYSRARASGLWQFIPGTGSRFGLKQNWWYDGRRDVVESTRAALDYLQYLHDEFDGDWFLAIAGYNCGEAAVARAVAANKAAGKPTDFFSLKLPAETRAYVPKLVAMKRLVADPEAFGLAFSRIPNQPYFTRVPTQGQIDLRVAAEISGLTYEELYELNPAFHRWATDPQGPHFLLVPTDAADAFSSNVAQLTDDERLKVRRYMVQKGDSVSSVARKFNTTIQVVRELNAVPTGTLVVGSELRVPSEVVQLPPKVVRAAALVDSRDRRDSRRPHMHVVVRNGDTLWRIARRHGMDVNQLAMMNGMQPGDTLKTGQKLKLNASNNSSGGSSKSSASSRKVTYTVRNGDTLSRIARVFQVTVSQILSWNSLGKTASIQPGQKLLILVARRS